MTRSTLFAGLAGLSLTWLGCSGGGSSPDASTTDAGSPADSGVLDSGVLDSSPKDSDPGDAGPGTPDAAEDADSAPGDASVDAAPAVPVTLADIVGLVDFDFEGNTLAYRESSDPTRIHTCSIPGCTTGPLLSAIVDDGFDISMARGRIYYTFTTPGRVSQLRSIRQDGIDDKLETQRSATGIFGTSNFYGGVENHFLDCLSHPLAGMRQTVTAVLTPPVGRTASVPKASKYRHSNGDGAISQPVHGPGLPFSTTGATVPIMDGQTEIATTTRTVAGAPNPGTSSGKVVTRARRGAPSGERARGT